MDHREVGRYWEGNAEAWTTLARQGYDVSRDWVNTPAFLKMLPEVSGMAGLDIGAATTAVEQMTAMMGANRRGIVGNLLADRECARSSAGANHSMSVLLYLQPPWR